MSKDVWLTFDFAKDHWVLAVKPELNNTVGVSCLYGTNPEGMVFNEYYSHTADALHYVTARELRDKEKIFLEQSKKEWSKSLNASFKPILDGLTALIKGIKKMTNKYKPFDLKRALSGDKFVRADGAVPSEWHWFKHLENDNEKLAVIIDGHLDWFDEKGINCRCGNECNDNLVMVPIKKQIWVAVNKGEVNNFRDNLKYRVTFAYSFESQYELVVHMRQNQVDIDAYHIKAIEVEE